MKRHFMLLVMGAMVAGLVAGAQQKPVTTRAAAGAPIDVTVREGTSMSVAVSPDGRTLATDMQGSIWTLPAAGGAMTRITDPFNDARQPMWSPDGRTITFFAYRDGGYDLWSVNPDGSNQRKVTWGTFDDREPIWSHDGTRVAFSSDRGNTLGSDYNIWMLDTRTGAPSPSSPRRPAKTSCRRGRPTTPRSRSCRPVTHYDGVWVINVATGAERKVRTVKGARVDSPSWGPGGQLLYHVTAAGQTRFEIDGKAVTGCRERVRVPRLLGVRHGVHLRVGRQDSPALGDGLAHADGGLHGHDAGDPSRVSRGASATSPPRPRARRSASSGR